MPMVNFDNAATSFPKPYEVEEAMLSALKKYGGNPGRSGHRLSMETAEAVYKAREICGEFFGAEPENTVFTLNCTSALNFAIKGMTGSKGHIVTSDLEHNSVIRPVSTVTKSSGSFTQAHVSDDDEKTFAAFEEAITPDTKVIVCTAASNVTGQILPFERIAELCAERNICFILDAAQAAGVIPLKIGNGINFICAPGHKGLYGPTGTGLLISDGKYLPETIIEGGTGSLSMMSVQPDFLPDRLESGTINTVGAIALGNGVKFVRNRTVGGIFAHEEKLCEEFINDMSKLPEIVIFRGRNARYVPIVSFNVAGKTANETSALLSEAGYYLRGGLHCAGAAHTALGTAPDGTVRFAPSVFNTSEQVNGLVNEIKKISQKP